MPRPGAARPVWGPGARPEWLALRCLRLAGSAAERLALVMEEGCLLGRHVALLRARRRADGRRGEVAAQGWACAGPGGRHSLRHASYRLAGGSGLALAGQHLCAWRGAPTAADGALLGRLSARQPRPAPVDMLVAPAALGGAHTLLVVVDNGELPLAARGMEPFLKLVWACSTPSGRAPPAAPPASWQEVAAAARQAASWAAGANTF